MLRNLSPGLQVLIFLFMVYFLAGMGSIVFQIALSMVLEPEQLMGISGEDPRIIITYNLFFQVFAFLVSFLGILRFCGQRFEAVVSIGKLQWRPLLITLGVFIIAILVLPYLNYLNEPLKEILPQSIIEREVYRNTINQNLMVQGNPVQFIFVLIVMAVLPAICEELVFRGFLLKKMFESRMSHHAAVIVSAAIFALTHFQPMKFVPIFVMGLALGYIYVYFKNIKYAMLLHFLFNGSQIFIGYLVGSGVLDLEI